MLELQISFFSSFLSSRFFQDWSFKLSGCTQTIIFVGYVTDIEGLLAVVPLNDLFSISLHGVSFAGTCWTVDKDCAILAIKECMAQLKSITLVKGLFLCCLRI